MKTKSIISIIEVVLFVVILTSLVSAATLTRTTQTTVQPGQQFNVTYTANDPTKWFVAWSETISGGCTPSPYVDFMISETGGSKSVQNSFTAPSSGSCVFSGYYQFADFAQVNFPQLTITVSTTCTSNCAGKTCGDDGCGGTCPPGCSSGYSCPAGTCVSTGGGGGGGGGGGRACTNQCTPSGTKQCVGNGYKTCGNYDADNCYEWSGVINCTAGQSCSNGACISTGGECVSDWNCTEWGECLDNEKTRTCTDLNNCKADKIETQSCVSGQFNWSFWIIFAIIIGIVIMAGVIIYLVYKRKKGNIQELKKVIKEKEEVR